MRRPGYNFLIALFLCSLASLFILSKFNYPLTGIDDANIYFVYARNLASDHGFVYNIGGERVEGFTSLLWTLISAVAFKLSHHPEVFLLIIDIVIVSAGLAAALNYLQSDFWKTEKSSQSRFLWSGVFLLILVTSPRYIIWNTITLMENGLWSTLLLMTTILVINDHFSAKTISFGLIPLWGLLILTRPESMMWVVVFLGIVFFRFAVLKNVGAAFRLILPAMVTTAAALVLLTLFRVQYFGYPLPNTYYAKVSPSFTYNLEEGGIYLLKYITSDPIDFLSVSLVFLSVFQSLYKIFSKRISSAGRDYLPIIAGSGLLMPLITGGDHFGSFRFYQNIYPITLLSLFHILDRILLPTASMTWAKALPKWLSMTLQVTVILLAGTGLFLSQAQIWKHLKSEIDTEFQVASYERKNGTLIQELFSRLPKLPSIGVIAAGGIKYYYEGEIVDLMGLNNTVMAHNGGERTGYKNHAAFEVMTFFKLEPDIVWPKEVNESIWQFSKAVVMEGWENREGFKGLFDHPEFQKLYTFAEVSRSQQARNNYALVAWFKKDLLKELRANPDFFVQEFQTSP